MAVYSGKAYRFIKDQIKKGNLVLDPHMTPEQRFLDDIFNAAMPEVKDNGGFEPARVGFGLFGPMRIVDSYVSPQRIEEMQKRERALMNRCRASFLLAAQPGVSAMIGQRMHAGRVAFQGDIEEAAWDVFAKGQGTVPTRAQGFIVRFLLELSHDVFPDPTLENI